MNLSNIESLVFYITLFLLSVLFLYIGNKKNNRFFKIIAILIPILIGGFRYYVGTDYTNYIDYYNVYSPLTITQYLSQMGVFEILFYIISRLSFVLANNYYLMFFVSNAIIVIFTFLAIDKLKIKNKYLVWAIFLFLYFPMMLNAVRQGISVAITFYMLALFFDKDFKKALIMAILSPLFHTSGLITIIIFFIMYLLQKKLKKRNIKNIIIISFAILLCIPIFTNLITYLPFLQQYTKYETLLAEGNNYTFYLKLIILLVFFLFYKGMVNESKNAFFFYLLFSIEVTLTLLGFISPFVKRITLYFSLGQLLLLALLPELGANKMSRNFLNILVILYSVSYFILAYYYLGQSDVFPYQTIFF